MKQQDIYRCVTRHLLRRLDGKVPLHQQGTRWAGAKVRGWCELRIVSVQFAGRVYGEDEGTAQYEFAVHAAQATPKGDDPEVIHVLVDEVRREIDNTFHEAGVASARAVVIRDRDEIVRGLWQWGPCSTEMEREPREVFVDGVSAGTCLSATIRGTAQFSAASSTEVLAE